MHTQSVQHTLSIFQKLYQWLPPFVPAEIKKDMKSALEQIESNYGLTLDELEKTMLVFGKQIWPYRQAFQEFLDVYEGKLGEQYFLKNLSQDLKKRYQEFTAHGGGFRELHSGQHLGFFKPEERVELCEVLVKVQQAVRLHTIQAVNSTDQLDYQDRIVEFSTVLDDIEKRLDTLRQTADDEQEHPELASEIREQIRAFEYGLCSLGPQTEHHAVCEMDNFFVERRLEKNLMR